MIRAALALSAALIFAAPVTAQDTEQCGSELVVLGAGQDAGAPQIGNIDDKGPRLLPTSLGLIDRVAGRRYLFDATPAITEQLAMLDIVEPPQDGLGIDGIFLTHAHVGHYLGLAYLGREAAGAENVPVYALPRMAEFLRTNGPWSQLVELDNIQIIELEPKKGFDIWNGHLLAPSPVPHRDEYSETTGYSIFVPQKSGTLQWKVGYFPDFDDWEGWRASNNNIEIGEYLTYLEYLFIDATFYDDNELANRDMSEIPHPRVTETMALLANLPADQRAKVHFIHYNHTNPIRDPHSVESKNVLDRGFNIARRGDRFCLN